MRIVTRADLCKKMANGEEFALVEVLPAEAYQHAHLPGAINLPLGEGFEARAQRTLPDKEQDVVVYCSDENSSASAMAAKRLKAVGYGHVSYYELGKNDWMRAGLAMMHTGDATLPRVLG
jgi:rhodanese-related sulfurtransferase